VNPYFDTIIGFYEDFFNTLYEVYPDFRARDGRWELRDWSQDEGAGKRWIWHNPCFSLKE